MPFRYCHVQHLNPLPLMDTEGAAVRLHVHQVLVSSRSMLRQARIGQVYRRCPAAVIVYLINGNGWTLKLGNMVPTQATHVCILYGSSLGQAAEDVCAHAYFPMLSHLGLS